MALSGNLNSDGKPLVGGDGKPLDGGREAIGPGMCEGR
jgi:hypothetical protein